MECRVFRVAVQSGFACERIEFGVKLQARRTPRVRLKNAGITSLKAPFQLVVETKSALSERSSMFGPGSKPWSRVWLTYAFQLLRDPTAASLRFTKRYLPRPTFSIRGFFLPVLENQT